MSKYILFGLLVAAGSAQAMTDARGLSCAQANALVKSEGAVILQTGEYTYDRYVAHQGYCLRGEKAQPAWIATADSDACFVGYTCEQGGNNH